MSPSAKTMPGPVVNGSRVDDLVQQLAEVRAKLVEERQLLMARVGIIDEALGPQPVKPQAVRSAKTTRIQGVGDAVLAPCPASPVGHHSRCPNGSPGNEPELSGEHGA